MWCVVYACATEDQDADHAINSIAHDTAANFKLFLLVLLWLITVPL